MGGVITALLERLPPLLVVALLRAGMLLPPLIGLTGLTLGLPLLLNSLMVKALAIEAMCEPSTCDSGGGKLSSISERGRGGGARDWR